MGNVASKAADGLGGLVGNAIAAPFKAIFGGSCEGVCSGTWDLPCFIEHLCVSDLFKLLMISGLCYITLLFFYLLFKVGICQCIGKGLCKMCWAAFTAYWFALRDITRFLFHSLKNVKRRRRFRDTEAGYGSSGDDGFNKLKPEYEFSTRTANRRMRRRRKDRGLRSSLNINKHHHRHRHLLRPINAAAAGGGSHDQSGNHFKERYRCGELKKWRHGQMRKASSLRREAALSQRRFRHAR